jgi:purine-binding chemotaxis protein CheW
MTAAKRTTVSALSDEQLVGLELAGELYGVPIACVQEIIRMQPITVVPNSPAFVEGMTNLRGRVIPVMDLRARFGLEATTTNGHTRIVVAELGEHTVGLIVDGVSEVLRVAADMIEPPSSLVTTADSAYLRGVAKLEDRLILLLNLACILSPQEQTTLAE